MRHIAITATVTIMLISVTITRLANDASNFVRTVEEILGIKISIPEEIAYNNGWISKDELQKAYELYQKNQYGKYLKDVLEGKYID